MRVGLSVSVEHRQGAFTLAAAVTAPNGVTALFGPSGSGKTTLVNVIGGLVRPDRGRVEVDGVTLVDTERNLWVARHRRRIGTVFQDARLFPHLSVRRNLAFGRWFAPRDGGADETASVVALLGLGHLLDRRPAGLSGGERQRVALGRALLSRPRLLLMDEPLAALDEARKAEVLPHLERLRDEARMPIVYVSHSLAEVARLADTLVVLEAGHVVAAGPAAEVMARLDVPVLSRSREGGAVLPGRVAGHDPAFGLSTIATPAGDLRVPQVALALGATLRVQVAARDVMLSVVPPQGISALNVLPGLVEAVTATEGAGAEIRLRCGEAALLARLTRRSVVDLDLGPGRTVFAIVKSVALDARPGPAGLGEEGPWRG